VHQTSYTDHEIGKCMDNAVTRISCRVFSCSFTFTSDCQGINRHSTCSNFLIRTC